MPSTILGELNVSKPPEWEDRSQIIFRAPPSEAFTPNVVVVAEDLGELDFPTFIADHIDGLRESFDALRVELDEEVTLGANHGYVVQYVFRGPGAGPVGVAWYRQRQFFLQRGSMVYTFTYSDSDERFAEGVAVLESVAGSASFPADRGPSRDADTFGPRD
jgi:hypothetical protein